LELTSDKSSKWYYIERFAIAQSVMGVDETLKVSREVIGNNPLEKAEVHQLDRIIKILRRKYLNDQV
tara:strand:- start:517 stop:717 length:201 start_codon:yes stop_codon:yes gene_type:complete